MARLTRDELDEAFDSYLEAALWSSTDYGDESGGEPLDANYGPGDIASKTLREMRKELKDFLESNAELILESGMGWASAAYDFWLTRNGHGAGFWDRGLGDIGRELTKASKPYGSYDLYVGDDGKVHGQ